MAASGRRSQAFATRKPPASTWHREGKRLRASARYDIVFTITSTKPAWEKSSDEDHPPLHPGRNLGPLPHRPFLIHSRDVAPSFLASRRSRGRKGRSCPARREAAPLLASRLPGNPPPGRPPDRRPARPWAARRRLGNNRPVRRGGGDAWPAPPRSHVQPGGVSGEPLHRVGRNPLGAEGSHGIVRPHHLDPRRRGGRRTRFPGSGPGRPAVPRPGVSRWHYPERGHALPARGRAGSPARFREGGKIPAGKR